MDFVPAQNYRPEMKMYQSDIKKDGLAFKPKAYRFWTALVGLFFGACAAGLYSIVCFNVLNDPPLGAKVFLGLILVVCVLAMASAPYSYAACVVLKEGISVPDPTDGSSSWCSGGSEVLLVLPFILFCIMFLPNYTEPIEWESIQSARLEKGFFGTSLVLDMGGYKRKIGWPLADTKGFQKAVFRYAPFQNPLFQLMRSF